MRTEQEIIELYTRHVEMVYRICFMFFKNKADAEDATQDIFIKIIQKNYQFENLNHEKATLIVAAQNHCKNILTHWSRRNLEYDPNIFEGKVSNEQNEVLQQVLELPQKYKLPIYLYYYEGYKTDEIARILKINSSTLRSRLKKGRELLKMVMEGDEIE